MSAIEWTDETWNPTVGCSRVSAGCENCYAERVAHRGMTERHRGLTVMGRHGPRWNGTVKLVPEVLSKPLHWQKPRRVFVDSMSDLFHPGVPFEYVAAVFGVMAATHWHTYQVLTKRPQRAVEFFRWYEVGVVEFHAAMQDCLELDTWPLPNVWLGVSVEDQRAADERIPLLLECPASVRFLSCEPLLGPVNLEGTGDIDWVIVGGESGPGARPCNLDWVYSIVAQCREMLVPAFVKQLGAKPIDTVGLELCSGCEVGGIDEYGEPYPDCSGHPVMEPLVLQSKKGKDMSEWPEGLRIREFPEVES